MVQAKLNGFLPPDFVGSLPTVDLRHPPTRAPGQFPPFDIRDGRAFQADAASEAGFFADHGFVLLSHRTSVADWDDVAPIFAEEVEQLIRTRLLPGRRLEIQQRPTPMRRGRGTDNPQYAGGVHSDGPLTAELYAANVGAFAGPQAEKWWLDRFRRPDVAGFMSIDFWRTTNMQGSLRHMPWRFALRAASSGPTSCPWNLSASLRTDTRASISRFDTIDASMVFLSRDDG